MTKKMTTPSTAAQPSTNESAEGSYESQDLFCGKQEIIIKHAGHTYRLRITRQDKLILTK